MRELKEKKKTWCVLHLNQRYHPSKESQTHILPWGSVQKVWHHYRHRTEGNRTIWDKQESTHVKTLDGFHNFWAVSEIWNMYLSSVMLGSQSILTECRLWHQWTSSPLLYCRVSEPTLQGLKKHTDQINDQHCFTHIRLYLHVHC